MEITKGEIEKICEHFTDNDIMPSTEFSIESTKKLIDIHR